MCCELVGGGSGHCQACHRDLLLDRSRGGRHSRERHPPPGALQLVCGSARNILDFVDERDVVTFTGSAATGKRLKANPRLMEHAVPFNMEADSLNAAILGPDAGPGTRGI